MHGWEPQRLTFWFERTKVATAGNDAVVEINRLWCISEHWLDFCCPLNAIQVEHLSPNKFATHACFNDWVQIETEGIIMLWFHIRAQNSWSVLEEFLGVNNRDQEV